jgi:hypothetical protein
MKRYVRRTVPIDEDTAPLSALAMVTSEVIEFQYDQLGHTERTFRGPI